jgi:sugar phosphate isomerase/epimerase
MSSSERPCVHESGSCPVNGLAPDGVIGLSSQTLGRVPFAARAQMAADAGFGGLGLSLEDYLAARMSGLDDDDMIGLLDRLGLRVVELEFLSTWADPATRAAADEVREKCLLELASIFQVRQINVGVHGRFPAEVLAESFAQLCDRAGEVEVALEFMPFGGVPDLETAWEVVRRSARPNGGLVVDTWHWARSATRHDALASVPPDRILVVQLADVAASPLPHLREESLHHRLPPGRGFGDIASLVADLVDRGVRSTVTVEVMSDELRRRGPITAARETREAACDVLHAVTHRKLGPVPDAPPDITATSG